MLNWTDQVRAGALNHGSGAPADPPSPNVEWAQYLNDDTGDRYVWTGSAWVLLA